MKISPYLFLLFTLLLNSCATIEMSISEEIVDYPDIEGRYPGGPKKMKKYIAKNTIYPEKALESGDHGKVFVQFTIEKDGSLSNIEVLKGRTKELDAEAIRVISEMPNWTPAIYEGKYVRAKARLPINYILR
jgi:protein TonB